MKEMKKMLISVLLMLTMMTTAVGAVNYNTHVDSYVGFYRVQASPSVGLFSPMDFTINVGDTLRWINDDKEPLTLEIIRNGIYLESIPSHLWGSLWGPSEGTYEFYIKEYPNFKHQKITVVGYKGDIGTCEYPGNPPCSPGEVVETPVPCSEYVAAHPEIYPISSCQQIVSSWKNNITNDGKTGITVDVGTTVRFSITTNSDIRTSSAVVEPDNVFHNLYYGPRISFGDVKFDKVGHYKINLRASNSFARGGVTWNVYVVNVVVPPTPGPGQIYSYDNIKVKHKIELCNPASDAEYAITGIFEKNCGHPDLNIDNYPLDILPSGGNSGKVSASEMVLVKITMIEDNYISLVPWETDTIIINWYDGSDNRLMFGTSREATSFKTDVRCFIGHFSWEINKAGKYYVDVITENGDARVVFDVISNPVPQPEPPRIIYPTPTPTISVIPTMTPTVTVLPIPTVNVNPPLGSVGSVGAGCWDSYANVGYCAGKKVTEFGVAFIAGIGKAFVDIFGL